MTATLDACRERWGEGSGRVGRAKGRAASRRTWRRSTRAGTAPALTIAFAAFGSRLARDLGRRRRCGGSGRRRSGGARRGLRRGGGGERQERGVVRGAVRGLWAAAIGNGLRRQHRSDRFPSRRAISRGRAPLRLLVIPAVEQRIHQRADGGGARARRGALPERLGGNAGRPGVFMKDDRDQYRSILAAGEAGERGELRRPEHRRLVQPREPRRVGGALASAAACAAGGGERRRRACRMPWRRGVRGSGRRRRSRRRPPRPPAASGRRATAAEVAGAG